MQAILPYIGLIVLGVAAIAVARNKNWRSTEDLYATADRKTGIVIIDDFSNRARRRAHHDIG